MRRLIATTFLVAIGLNANAAVIFTGGGLLSGSQEVPPNSSPATGTAQVTVDDRNDSNPNTNRLSWNVTFANLTTPITTAHFHGPALPGQNAPVQVPIIQSLVGDKDRSGLLKGSANITAGDFSQLAGGKWYVNVHSTRYPQGEIRAQIIPASTSNVPEPSSLALLGLALAGFVVPRVRGVSKQKQ